MLSASISVFPREPLGEISPFLHGQSLELGGECAAPGVWVGEESDIPHQNGVRLGVLQALKTLEPPVIRCGFASNYYWRDGIGANRPTRVSGFEGTDHIESNGFGTHEFLELCRDVSAQPYLGASIGGTSPREVSQWVEHCNFAGGTSLSGERVQNGSEKPFGVDFWGIGNGDEGFSPESYAAQFRAFESVFPRFANQNPSLIAVGPDANFKDRAAWTRQLLHHLERGRAPRLGGIDTHFSVQNRNSEFGTATEFSLDEYYGILSQSLQVGAFIDEQREILDASILGRAAKLVIGKWGVSHPQNERIGWQPNTLRDAIFAAMTLDALHHKAGKIAMANLSAGVNLGQSLLHTFGDVTIQTPTFHVFEAYKRHRGGQLLHADFESGEAGGLPRLSGSASLRDGIVTLSVVNSGAKSPVEATISLPGQKIELVAARELTGSGLAAQNTLENPDALAPREIAPVFDATNDASSLTHTFAPASVTVFLIQLG